MTDLPQEFSISFGPFNLFPSGRRLEKEGIEVAVGSRALDILISLVERAGNVVGKRELISRVWPDTIVEENTLRVHIAGLRKTLERDVSKSAKYIVNVPGRGYLFVGAISFDGKDKAPFYPHPPTSENVTFHSLPPAHSRMVGRDDAVRSLAMQLKAERFLSIVGPGGMGKTTVAVAIAHQIVDEFSDGALFIDLGAITDGQLLAGTMLAALGSTAYTSDLEAALAAVLRPKNILLVLDNCEHVIERVAVLAERIYGSASDVYMLTTSREPLRAEGEFVHRLPPLEFPPPDVELTAEHALSFPAVQLFVERAAAGGDSFDLDDGEAALVGEICRRLDGIALAIELGAGRVSSYGIRGTAALLNSRFHLMWRGKRTALPRHQTLAAMLDWSFNLLPDFEQLVLRRLSVFKGSFNLRGAQVIVANEQIEPIRVVDAVGNLVAKSLATVDDSGTEMRYRLLDTSREYASAKLWESGESNEIYKRHASYFVELLQNIESEVIGLLDIGEILQYAAQIGDIRAALEWCFSSKGDNGIAVLLASLAAPVFLQLSLLVECQRWAGRALWGMDKQHRDIRQKMLLWEAESVSSIAKQAAASSGSVESMGTYAIARSSLEVTYHLVGDQAATSHHCEAGNVVAPTTSGSKRIFFGFDHRVRAMLALARSLWLRGYPDSAARTAKQAIAEASELEHPVTECIALIYAAPVFLWNGDWDACGEAINSLTEHSTRHSLGPYQKVASCLKGQMLICCGDAVAGVAILQRTLEALKLEHHQVLRSSFVCALCEGLASLGSFDDALQRINEIVPRDDLSKRRWDGAEVLRIRGRLLAQKHKPDMDAADRCLMASLNLAREQSATSFELRTAMTRYWLMKGSIRSNEARNDLHRVLAQCTEGFDTIDFLAASSLLADDS